MDKELSKLQAKKGELAKLMEKLHDKMATGDYRDKVPLKVQQQDSEKVMMSAAANTFFLGGGSSFRGVSH